MDVLGERGAIEVIRPPVSDVIPSARNSAPEDGYNVAAEVVRDPTHVVREPTNAVGNPVDAVGNPVNVVRQSR